MKKIKSNADIAREECSRCSRYINPETKEVTYDCLPEENLCVFFDDNDKDPKCEYFMRVVMASYLAQMKQFDIRKKQKIRKRREK